MQPALLPDVAERDVRQVRGGVPFGAGVFRCTEAVQRLRGDTARGVTGGLPSPHRGPTGAPNPPAVTQRLWGDGARGAARSWHHSHHPMEAQPWYPQVPPRDCKAGTVPPIPRIFLVPPQHPPPPPSAHPIGEEAPQHAEAGDPAGHPPVGKQPCEQGGTAGRGWGAAWCPYRPYLRIFPSSLNVFSPSSHDLERSVVMASR